MQNRQGNTEAYLLFIHPWQHSSSSSGCHEQCEFLSLAWMLNQNTPSAHETARTHTKPGIPHLPSNGVQIKQSGAKSCPSKADRVVEEGNEGGKESR